jgi:hypothetical protein
MEQCNIHLAPHFEECSLGVTVESYGEFIFGNLVDFAASGLNLPQGIQPLLKGESQYE